MKHESAANARAGIRYERDVPNSTSASVFAGDVSAVRKRSNWVRLFPIGYFVCYLSVTVLLFAFGPWEYPVVNRGELYLFLVLAHLALLGGYLTGAFGEGRGYSGGWKVGRIVQVSAIVNLLLLPPTSQFRTGSWIPDVARGLADPGGAYAASQFLREVGEPAIEYVRIFLGPFLVFLLPPTVFYWGQLTRFVRALGLAGVLGTVALFVAMGTNKAVADTALVVPWLLVGAYLCGPRRRSRWGILTAVVAGAGALGLFLSFFGSAVSSRAGSPIAWGYFPATGSRVNYDNRLVRYLPAQPAQVAIGLDNYLTAGYYALGLSLQEPFVPMYGAGNSMFLYRQVARLTGNQEILEDPYPVRIGKYGWDSQGLWSSIYPWIASDVSFPGTILIVFLIGRAFALSWLDTLRGANPFAVVVFAQFVIMLYYFPANNQLLQAGEGFTGFWASLTLWLWTRRRGRRALRSGRALLATP